MTRSTVFATAACLLLAWSVDAAAGRGWQELQGFELAAPAQDTAVSPDGRWIYVLADGGRLLVYTAEGRLKDTIELGPDVASVTAGPGEGILILSGPASNRLRIVEVGLQYDFDFTGSPSRGPSGAPVVVTVFSDFQCPACAAVAAKLDAVQKRHPDKVRLVFKNFPLTRIHPYAYPAAQAAMAAETRGRFWAFHDRLFADHQNFDEKRIAGVRSDLELDDPDFEKTVQSQAVAQLIQRDFNEGRRAGVDGTPTVFVNGRRFKAPKTEENLLAAVEEALETAEP